MREDILIRPAAPDDIEGVTRLLYLKPPTTWFRRVSPGQVKKFVEYSVKSPRCVILVAIPRGENTVAGYVLSVIDSNRFWRDFSFKNPAAMTSIMFHRFMRVRILNRERRKSTQENDNARLPVFSWSPSSPEAARIMGIYVDRMYRRMGIATYLYLRLFDALRERGCLKVEEYMGPDYYLFAGKFPQTCGWLVQQQRGAGYKITKNL